MITRASHFDRSAFLTSSRAWFLCSGGQNRWQRYIRKRPNRKYRTKWQNENMEKGRERDTFPSTASRVGSGRIDSISPYRARHITLADPVATQQLQGSLAGLQTSVTDKFLHVCTCIQCSACACVFSMCVCECWLMCWRRAEIFVQPSFIGDVLEWVPLQGVSVGSSCQHLKSPALPAETPSE